MAACCETQARIGAEVETDCRNLGYVDRENLAESGSQSTRGEGADSGTKSLESEQGRAGPSPESSLQ